MGGTPTVNVSLRTWNGRGTEVGSQLEKYAHRFLPFQNEQNKQTKSPERGDTGVGFSP